MQDWSEDNISVGEAYDDQGQSSDAMAGADLSALPAATRRIRLAQGHSRGGRPLTWIGGAGMDTKLLAQLGVPKLRELFLSHFGEPTASNNAAWLRRKLSERPDAVYGQGRCERVRARDAGAAIWSAPGGGAGGGGGPHGAGRGAPKRPSPRQRGYAFFQAGPGGGRYVGGGGAGGGGMTHRVALRLGDLPLLRAGTCVEVFWPDDGQWWPATVLGADAATRRLQLLYDTLQEEEITGPDFDSLIGAGHLAVQESDGDDDDSSDADTGDDAGDAGDDGPEAKRVRQSCDDGDGGGCGGSLPLVPVSCMPRQLPAPLQVAAVAEAVAAVRSNSTGSGSGGSAGTHVSLAFRPDGWEGLARMALPAACGGDGSSGSPLADSAGYGGAAAAAPSFWATAAAAAGLLPASFLWGGAAAAAAACSVAGGFPALPLAGAPAGAPSAQPRPLPLGLLMPAQDHQAAPVDPAAAADNSPAAAPSPAPAALADDAADWLREDLGRGPGAPGAPRGPGGADADADANAGGDGAGAEVGDADGGEGIDAAGVMPTLDDGMLSLMRDVQSGDDSARYYAPCGAAARAGAGCGGGAGGSAGGEEAGGAEGEGEEDGGLSSYLAGF
ncbi:hypothetical protein Rsub_00841 [Raphidocelis subcapitata]|uniref:Uncharacterized protein n=1 Tax=Raphidocelis subcapitata TaxID=307507 RepID=A0A2V0NLW7_9CHLO|nr:hypothetical protein Rsub_00841 [Raphidocelis subcapitata]|eukprot:GBF88129.1 hypothetical protein Rsub_00841 [Raphidocelis subcapitata]